MTSFEMCQNHEAIRSVVGNLQMSVSDIISESSLNNEERVFALLIFIRSVQSDMIDYYKYKLSE